MIILIINKRKKSIILYFSDKRSDNSYNTAAIAIERTTSTEKNSELHTNETTKRIKKQIDTKNTFKNFITIIPVFIDKLYHIKVNNM